MDVSAAISEIFLNFLCAQSVTVCPGLAWLWSLGAGGNLRNICDALRKEFNCQANTDNLGTDFAGDLDFGTRYLF